LRGLYNPTDYPPVHDATREFGFSWQYVSFGVPDQLKGILQLVWEQEREKAAQRMAWHGLGVIGDPASAAPIDGGSGGAS